MLAERMIYKIHVLENNDEERKKGKSHTRKR